MSRKKRKKQKPLVQLVLPPHSIPQVNQSEVGRLLRQFELEQESAQRSLYGFAQVGNHEFIEARMTRMGVIQEELGKLVGGGRGSGTTGGRENEYISRGITHCPIPPCKGEV
jgi:hypothetical protein